MLSISTGWPICPDSWVVYTLIYDFQPLCLVARPLLPIFGQPLQKQAEVGTTKIRVNRAILSDQMDHPVYPLMSTKFVH